MRVHFPDQHKTFEVPEGTRISDVIRTHLGPVLPMPCGGGGACGKCLVRLEDGKRVLACQTLAEPEMKIYLNAPQKQSILCAFAPEILKGMEPDDSGESEFSIAFDLGTTTLAAVLLRNGKVLASVSRPNPQSSFGADVISRIQTGMTPDGRLTLQTLLLRAVSAMALELFSLANLKAAEVRTVRLVTFAGNTTMEETLLGLDLTSLSAVPFTPSEELKSELTASDPLWNGKLAIFAPQTRIQILPVFGAFTGGDILAGILACRSVSEKTEGSDASRYPAFFLDLGTNGEMVLETETSRTACAAAAGPCFEGAAISCGICAGTGAILHIKNQDGKPVFETFLDSPIRGICGSALIDLAAELLRLGLLTPDGRILEPEEISPDVPRLWAQKILRKKIRPKTSLSGTSQTFQTSGTSGTSGTPGASGTSGTPAGQPVETLCFHIAGDVHVTQADFRELQLAVGAIRTGIRLLLRREGLSPSDLRFFRIAGGFGKGINLANAQAIGLIPASIPPASFQFLGNASLAGAVLVSLLPKLWKETESLARETLSVDLALEEGFSDVFMESMFFESGF